MVSEMWRCRDCNTEMVPRHAMLMHLHGVHGVSIKDPDGIACDVEMVGISRSKTEVVLDFEVTTKAGPTLEVRLTGPAPHAGDSTVGHRRMGA
jgi:hypothetical protein